MTMKPLFTQVLINIEKAEQISSSGIYLSIADDKKLEKATVLEVGEDVTTLKKGDTILFKAYIADTIELDGKEISFVKEEDVLAVIQ